jgi:hypothetical protein
VITAVLQQLGRWTLTLVVMVGVILSAHNTECCVGHDHDDEGGTPTHMVCTCTAHDAIVPVPTAPMSVATLGVTMVTDYLLGQFPRIVADVDPPPNKSA